jgi:hypothetical protein
MKHLDFRSVTLIIITNASHGIYSVFLMGTCVRTLILKASGDFALIFNFVILHSPFKNED